jgi:DNA-binding GntR family transcriptional regulator
LCDDAYAQLRDWIIDGTLAPGESLRDEALAEALGMSRTPVRDALQRLENEGLVVTSSTRRTSVSPVTLKQARDIYPITKTLEAMALRLALPQMDAAALDAMRTANVALAAALAAGNAATATLADEAVHGALIARCGNDELQALLADLKAKVRRLECAFWGWADRTPSVRDQ